MKATLARLASLLRRFSIADRGIAAVEFALILPFMALLYLGGFEVMQEIAIKRQVALTASTVASIVTQYSSISASQTMPGILAAASSVLTPYSSSHAVVTVTCITINNSGTATVAWSQSLNGTARTTGSTVTLPSALDVANTTVILGETTYSYTPVIDFMHLGTSSLDSSVYMLPRQPGRSRSARSRLASAAAQGARRVCAAADLRPQRCEYAVQRVEPAGDAPAIMGDEILDLEIDGRTLIVGGQPEIAAIARNRLAAGEGIADFRRRPAVDIAAVEHGQNAIGAIDAGDIVAGDFDIDPAPGPRAAARLRVPRWRAGCGTPASASRDRSRRAACMEPRDEHVVLEPVPASVKPSGPAR